MAIDTGELRRWARGGDDEVVQLTARAVRALADEIDRLRRIESHVHWRDRVNQAVRDCHQAGVQ